MRAAILAVALLTAVPALAAEEAGDGAGAAVVGGEAASCPEPTAQQGAVATLICRDATLGAAWATLGETVDAFTKAVGPPGGPAFDADQRAWLRRRDAACPTTAADLDDPAKAKARVACLAQQITDRTKALEEELSTRRTPVADEPLTVSDASPSRLVPPSRGVAGPAPPKRRTGAATLLGRWAKADPRTREPIDDCRSSFLELSEGPRLSLHDPRIAAPPLDGPVTVEDGDPTKGVGFAGPGEGDAKGRLTLEAGDTPRLDRLFLRLDQPFVFAATFVRCR